MVKKSLASDKSLRDEDFESLRIDVSDRCNNNCIFCCDSERQKMKQEEVVKVLEEHRHLGKLTFSCGEPTLNKDLISWIRTAKNKGYEKINLVTNGRMLAYYGYAKKILSSGLNEITISIHSHDPKIHNALTRTISFNQTKKALKNISLIKKRYPVKFKINATITKANHDFHGFYSFLSKYSVQSINLNVVKPQGNAFKNSHILLPYYSEIVKEFNDFKNKHYDLKIPVTLSGIPSCINKEGREYEKMQIYYKGEYHDNEEFENKIKPDSCRKCSINKNCAGIWQEYARIYGVDEFKPIIILKKELWEDPLYLMPIAAVKQGIKPCARIELVKISELQKIISLIIKYELHYKLMAKQFVLDAKNMKFSQAKFESEDNYTSIFISKDKELLDELAEATELEHESGKDSAAANIKTGRLLGYPLCCVERFAGIEEYVDDKTANLALKKNTIGKLNWKLNNLINPYRLIEFFPCSYNCRNAASYADKMLDLAANGKGDAGQKRDSREKIKKILKSHVLYQNFNNYIVFDGESVNDKSTESTNSGIVYNSFIASTQFAADFMEPGSEDLYLLADILKKGNKICFDCHDQVTQARVFKGTDLIGELKLKDTWCLFDFRNE